MNLKFIEFIEYIEYMIRTTLLHLSIIVITYNAYLTYKYFINKKAENKECNNKECNNKEGNNKEGNNKEGNNKKADNKEGNNNIDIEMERIENIEDEELTRFKCINEYKLILEKKQQLLSSLITQLDTISSDILKIKENLENLNSVNNKQVT